MREPWIQTYTGKQFSYLECSKEQIDIVDIARALSHICRFTGHCKVFYSVAQHCVLVSQNTIHPLLGLMHDAAEAYVGDVNRPLKSLFESYSEYRKADARAWWFIKERFFPLLEATIEDHDDCKNTDLRMLVTESHDLLMHGPHKDWQINQQTHPRYEFEIHPWQPDHAMEMFLARFNELTSPTPSPKPTA